MGTNLAQIECRLVGCGKWRRCSRRTTLSFSLRLPFGGRALKGKGVESSDGLFVERRNATNLSIFVKVELERLDIVVKTKSGHCRNNIVSVDCFAFLRLALITRSVVRAFSKILGGG